MGNSEYLTRAELAAGYELSDRTLARYQAAGVSIADPRAVLDHAMRGKSARFRSLAKLETLARGFQRIVDRGEDPYA